MDERKATYLYNTFSKRLYNTALRIVLSPEEADEIMQRSLIKFLQRAPRLEDESKIYNYLRATCVHLCIDYLRHQKKLVPLESLEPSQLVVEEDLPDEFQSREDLLPNILGAIGHLSASYRTIITLRLLEGYEYKEIARELSISESSVRSGYLRAKRKVCDEIRTIYKGQF